MPIDNTCITVNLKIITTNLYWLIFTNGFNLPKQNGNENSYSRITHGSIESKTVVACTKAEKPNTENGLSKPNIWIG
jgi:hypothetical protein